MALFKKFKNNIGIDEEKNDDESEEEEEEETEDDEEEQERESKKDRKRREKEEQKRKNNSKQPETNNKKDGWPESKGQLAADIYETENDFCIQAPIAGVSQEDIEIFVESNMLIVRGERTESDTTPNKKYYHKECYWGPFSRQTMLPEDVNTQKISASFRKGILTVRIPKKREEKRKITIEMN